MSIICHVRGDKHVLGETVMLQVIIEASEVFDLAETGGVVGDGIKQDQGIMLAHVVFRTGLRVPVSLVSRVWESLLVLTPRDALGVKHVCNGRYICRDLVEIVVVHAKIVATSGSTVVGLRGMGDSPEIGKGQAHCGQLR
jgi:hypothetical protein